MTCIAQAAKEQTTADRISASAAVINVEKPEMDINGVLFRDKGPRDHKTFCEQVFKQDKMKGEVTDWSVDIAWKDKYIWEIYPEHLDFSATTSGHNFHSHNEEHVASLSGLLPMPTTMMTSSAQAIAKILPSR
jgi:hypothetical protein